MEPHDQEPAAQSEGPAWRTLLEGRWEALGHQVLGLDPKASRKMSELGQECQALAAVAAWYEAGGNITRAAERLGTSRRVLRKRVARWREKNPQVPLPALGTAVRDELGER